MAETVSHNSEHGSYQQFLDDFQETIQDASLRLLKLSDEDADKRTTGEWSAKQVLGHLIDSAANNHQRFVRAQFTNDLVFQSYDGDQWVEAQKYNEQFWPDLIDLWRAYNLHLVRVVSLIPESVRTQQRKQHNFDQIAFKTIPKTDPTTLEYLIRDYVVHLKYHLDQIWSNT